MGLIQHTLQHEVLGFPTSSGGGAADAKVSVDGVETEGYLNAVLAMASAGFISKDQVDATLEIGLTPSTGQYNSIEGDASNGWTEGSPKINEMGTVTDNALVAADGTSGRYVKESGLLTGSGIVGGSILKMTPYTSQPAGTSDGQVWQLKTGGQMFLYTNDGGTLKGVELTETP